MDQPERAGFGRHHSDHRCIDRAVVDGRTISLLKDERLRAAGILAGPKAKSDGNASALIEAARSALYASKICSYSQGMKLLQAASAEYKYDLKLSEIARIWRAGCIIRAKLVNDVTRAYNREPQLPNLLLDSEFRQAVSERQEGWRFVVRTAVEMGVPVPAMSASLAYYDGYRSSRLPANLIQAQRDFFGAHTFERVDSQGIFHDD